MFPILLYMAEGVQAQDFRNSYWGDDIRTVQQTEAKDDASKLRAVDRYMDRDDLHQLVYYDEELGNRAFFVFQNRRLIMGYYEISYGLMTRQSIISTYNRFCDMMSGKYEQVDVNKLSMTDTLTILPRKNYDYRLLEESLWQTRQSTVNLISLRLFIMDSRPKIHLMYSQNTFFSSLEDIITRDPTRKY
mgnify:CR=1 FL=1